VPLDLNDLLRWLTCNEMAKEGHAGSGTGPPILWRCLKRYVAREVYKALATREVAADTPLASAA